MAKILVFIPRIWKAIEKFDLWSDILKFTLTLLNSEGHFALTMTMDEQYKSRNGGPMLPQGPGG